MNRTQRLYSLVEELRAATTSPTSAGDLAVRLDVSSRTIERDITTLQEAGLPIVSTAGRNGGYTLEDDHDFPPLHLTSAEAAAIAVALARTPEGPLAEAGRAARRKVMAAMSASDALAARHLASRIQALGGSEDGSVVDVLQEAIADHQVVELRYRGPDGTLTRPVVEPVGLTTHDRHWYLLAWSRRSDGHRSFRLDRIEEARPTGEAAATRDDVPEPTGQTTRLF